MGKPSFTQQSSNPDRKAGKVKKKVEKEAAVPSQDLENGSPLEGEEESEQTNVQNRTEFVTVAHLQMLLDSFKNDIVDTMKKELMNGAPEPPRKRRKITEEEQTSLQESDEESEEELSQSFTEYELNKITENLGRKLEKKQWTNVLMSNSLKKFADIVEPLPYVEKDAKLVLGKFTKFKRGMIMNYWLRILRKEFIACNVSNQDAHLFVPQLIEDPKLCKWAQHMIGNKALTWPKLVEMLALKANDYMEGSKALQQLEKMVWREEEDAGDFIDRFTDTIEKTHLDLNNPNIVLEYLTRAMSAFHQSEIMFVNRLFATLPEDWDLLTLSKQFMEMMPKLIKHSEAQRIKCLKCHKYGHIASRCQTTLSVKPFCSKCFGITGRKLPHKDEECRRSLKMKNISKNVKTEVNKGTQIYALRDYLTQGDLTTRMKCRWKNDEEKIKLV